MTSTTWLVEYHQLAVEEYAALKDKKQRKGVLTVADFLRQLGPKITEPHAKPVKGANGLYELRPSGGRALVRPLYIRVNNTFKILAIAPEAQVDPSGFDSAVDKARARAKDSYGVTV